MKNTEIKKGTIIYASTGVAVKVLEYSSKFGGRVLVERADGIEGGKPMWKPLDKFSETNPYPTKKMAKGSTLRANKSSLLKYVTFEDNWHINLLKLNSDRNNSGLKYKNKNQYAAVRSSAEKGQEVFEFKTLEEAEKEFDKLVAKSKTYSKIKSEGKTSNYEKGGSLVEPYFRFTKNDYNKLIDSGKFESVKNGNVLEIKSVDSSKKLGKYREEKEVIFVFGKKDLSNPLVVWLKENSFIPSSQIDKLAKGSKLMSNMEKAIKSIAKKHNGTINYILDKEDGGLSLDFNFPTPEDKQKFLNEMQEMNNATVRFSKGGNTPKSFEYSIGGL